MSAWGVDPDLLRVDWPLRDNTALSIQCPRGSLHLSISTKIKMAQLFTNSFNSPKKIEWIAKSTFLKIQISRVKFFGQFHCKMFRYLKSEIIALIDRQWFDFWVFKFVWINFGINVGRCAQCKALHANAFGKRSGLYHSGGVGHYRPLSDCASNPPLRIILSVVQFGVRTHPSFIHQPWALFHREYRASWFAHPKHEHRKHFHRSTQFQCHLLRISRLTPWKCQGTECPHQRKNRSRT